jgi:uncharacterized protein YdeI (YjbR/CyaY-like superfamily)
MSAARTLRHEVHRPSLQVTTTAIPAELLALFGQSAKVKTSFHRLPESDRRGFVRYINDATSAPARQRRAAIIAMSLVGLARDLRDENVGILR